MYQPDFTYFDFDFPYHVMTKDIHGGVGMICVADIPVRVHLRSDRAGDGWLIDCIELETWGGAYRSSTYTTLHPASALHVAIELSEETAKRADEAWAERPRTVREYVA